MNLAGWSLLIASCSVLSLVATGGSQGPSFRADTTAIVVDVTVRDRSGRPVVDLRREDFVVWEDGVTQDIAAFEPPSGATVVTAPEVASTRGSERTAAPLRLSYAALVFGRMSAQGKNAAVKASESFLRDMDPELDRVGVFSVDRTLVTLADFTDDQATLSRALRAASTRATGSPPAPSGADGLASAEYHGPMLLGVPSNQQQSDMGGFALEPDYEARASMLALAHLVDALGRVSGRKTIVYFAEALTVSSDVEPYYQGVVERANRNNVSIYPADTAGLRIHSADREFAGALNSSTAMAAGETVGPDVGYLNELSALLRSGNLPAVMATLATATGGTAITGTNDLVKGLARVNEDRRSYYLLTYVPKKPLSDGQYRRIVVRARQPNLMVHGRPGYIADGGSGAGTAFPFERSAIRALDGPATSDVPLAMRAYQFPLPDGRNFLALVARVPTEALMVTRAASEEQNNVAILARVLDARGTVVKSGSAPYRVLRKNGVAAAPAVTFFRQPIVKPGDYSVQAAVVDLVGHRTGVAKCRVSIPENRTERVRVSSIVLISEGRPGCGRATDRALHALCIGDLLLVPSAGEPVSRSKSGKATYYFTLVGPDVSSASAKLEIVLEGGVVGSTMLSLKRPDGDGTLRHAGTLPIAALRDGEYTLRVVVTVGVAHGVAQTVREAVFTVVP